MSWFGNNQPFEQKVSEATSESIPNGEIDLQQALEVSDLIRSKQMNAREAMRVLKRRILSNKDNPNVCQSSMRLVDFCIKNGGYHFVQEISSKEFLDPLAFLLKDHSESEKIILENIQNWSLLFSTDPSLSYITTVYDRLVKQGFKFPSVYQSGAEYFGAKFLDSRVAPEWEDSDACFACSTPFTFINRKHHCRSCGGVFCGQHSSKMCMLPELGITIPVRVCDECYENHQGTEKKEKREKRKKKPVEEDEDLKRAIEMSLGDAPKVAQKIPEQHHQVEEDPDMKRAIEASLQDFGGAEIAERAQEEPHTPHTPYAPHPLNNGNVVDDTPNISKVVAETLITPTDQENIHLFSTLLEKMKNSPVEAVHDETLQKLQSNVATLRPKLGKSLSETANKYESFTEMYSKIDAIVKLYDALLEKRLSNLYGRPERPHSPVPLAEPPKYTPLDSYRESDRGSDPYNSEEPVREEEDLTIPEIPNLEPPKQQQEEEEEVVNLIDL